MTAIVMMGKLVLWLFKFSPPRLIEWTI